MKQTPLPLLLALLLISACASDFSVDAPSSPIEDGKTTFKTRSQTGSGTASIPTNEDEFVIRDIEEDEATETLVATADKLRQKGDLVGANVLYQRAAASNPKSMKAQIGLARISEARDRPREAIEAYRGMLRIDGSYAPAYRGLGRNFMQLSLYDKAIKELEKLRQLKGDEAETLNLLAMAYLRNGDDAQAVSLLEQASAGNPEHLTTQNNLGFAYIMAGRLPDAISTLEKLAENVNATAQHRQNLALAYGLSGRENDARKVAMQDLPPAAVENNIKAYRAMREKKLDMRGAKPATKAPAKKPQKKTPAKPKAPEKTTEAPAADPVTAPIEALADVPAAAPITPVESQKAE